VLFKGLRVRMGVHLGTPRAVRDPMTRKVEYIGPVVNATARITALTHGGQIVLSQAVYEKVKATAASGPTYKSRLASLGKFEMPDAPNGARQLAPPPLCART
jgi:class 3 adenylate cyclase